jgi:hypothetical protein
MLDLGIDKTTRTFNLSLGDKGTWGWEAASLMYNYRLVGRGIVLNPDVCQLMTPAGLRSEHPLATIIGWCMSYAPTYENLKVLADHLVGVQGSFIFAATNSRRDKCVLVSKGMEARWDKITGQVKPAKGDIKQCTLLSIEKTGKVDSITLPISTPPVDRRLFVLDTFTDDWSKPWRKSNDIKISTAQIDYKAVKTHLDKGRSGPWYLNFVSRVLAFALDFPTAEVPNAIVLGLKPEDCDILLISALTRVVYAATNSQIRLEVPRYEQSIGYRITETH